MRLVIPEQLTVRVVVGVTWFHVKSNAIADLIGRFARVKLLLQTRSVVEIHRLDIFIIWGQRMTLPRRHQRLMAGSAAMIPRRRLGPGAFLGRS